AFRLVRHVAMEEVVGDRLLALAHAHRAEDRRFAQANSLEAQVALRHALRTRRNALGEVAGSRDACVRRLEAEPVRQRGEQRAVVITQLRDVSPLDATANDERRNPETELAELGVLVQWGDGGGLVIVETAVLVVRDNEQRVLPVRTLLQNLVDRRD